MADDSGVSMGALSKAMETLDERPRCGCSHCRDRPSPALVDMYGMHLSAAVAYYTRRHHLLAALFERFARQAGLTALHENKPFGASSSLSDEHLGKQVDTRLDGVEYDVIEHIVPGAAQHALHNRQEARLGPQERRQVLLDLLLDYTFHHPGAYLGLVKDLRGRLADLGEAMAEVAVRLKDDKYRHCATTCSTEHPFRPAMAFAPLVLSVCGRQHHITRRAMRYVARLKAVRGLCAPETDWRRGPELDADPNAHALKRRIGRKTHSTMTAFSSLTITALVDGLEEGARHAKRAGAPRLPKLSTPPAVRGGVTVAAVTSSQTTGRGAAATSGTAASRPLPGQLATAPCGGLRCAQGEHVQVAVDQMHGGGSPLHTVDLVPGMIVSAS